MVIGFHQNWEVQRVFLFIEGKFIPTKGKDWRLGVFDMRQTFLIRRLRLPAYVRRKDASAPYNDRLRGGGEPNHLNSVWVILTLMQLWADTWERSARTTQKSLFG